MPQFQSKAWNSCYIFAFHPFLSGQTSCFLPCCLETLLWVCSFAVVGRKCNCCLSLLAVNNIQILNGTIFHILYQVLTTTLDVQNPQEVLSWLSPWSHTFVRAPIYIPAQQRSLFTVQLVGHFQYFSLGVTVTWLAGRQVWQLLKILIPILTCVVLLIFLCRFPLQGSGLRSWPQRIHKDLLIKSDVLWGKWLSLIYS